MTAAIAAAPEETLRESPGPLPDDNLPQLEADPTKKCRAFHKGCPCALGVASSLAHELTP